LHQKCGVTAVEQGSISSLVEEGTNAKINLSFAYVMGSICYPVLSYTNQFKIGTNSVIENGFSFVYACKIQKLEIRRN